MANWLFSGCSNSIGDLIISANTIFNDYTVVVSGMCYVSVSAVTTTNYDIYSTSIINKDCSQCGDNSIRVSSCTDGSLYIMGAPFGNTDLPALGNYFFFSGETAIDCFQVIEDGLADDIIYLSGSYSIFDSFDDCLACKTYQANGCLSGITNGIYSFTDCCGIERNGVSIGNVYCIDTNLPYSGVTLSTAPCVPDCVNGELQAEFSVTGTCGNPTGGEIYVDVYGGVAPYTIVNTVPGTLSTQNGFGPFTYSGLSAGQYVFEITDGLGPQNNQIFLDVPLEGCLNIDISNYSNPECGVGTATVTISGDSSSLPYTYISYYEGSFQSSGTTNENPFDILSLNFGNYQFEVTDYGGATAQTSNHLVTGGTQLVASYSVTGQTPCTSTGLGIIEITGVTGVAPYEYLWFNGETGTTVTGLTTGYYSLNVTDARGCNSEYNIFVPFVSGLGVASAVSSPANCFECDGEILLTISGGTPPYTFSGDTGQILTGQTGTSFTLTGLCAGNHNIRVIDSGFCDILTNNNVPSTAGFTVVSVDIENVSCGDSDSNNLGSVLINVKGTNNIYTYTISGETTQNETTTFNQSHQFIDLTSGDYYITVSGHTGCFYEQYVTIQDISKFTISATTSGTTCNGRDGSAVISLYSGSTLPTYPVDYIVRRFDNQQVVYQNLNTYFSSVTVNTLESITYQVDVTDNENCKITSYFTLTGTPDVNFSILSNNCTFGDDGDATIFITSGQPPFSIEWSNGVTNVTSISNLSADTYSVIVTDANNCQSVRTFIITCQTDLVSTGSSYNICTNTFGTETGYKTSFYEMLMEGFLSMTNPSQNCVLNYAVFTGNLQITNDVFTAQTSQVFYTATTFNDIPSDFLWTIVVGNLLDAISEVNGYTIDLENNTYTIVGECDDDGDSLTNACVLLTIDIDISVDCSNPPSVGCDESFGASGGIGFYTTEWLVGTVTGETSLTFQSYSVPDRFLIYWDGSLVADSLFVGDGLPANYTNWVNQITSVTNIDLKQWNGSDFITTGTVNVNFTSDDIPDCNQLRSDANTTGTQLGVDTTYPSGSASNCDGNVRLKFNKTSEYPEYVQIVAIGPVSSTLWKVLTLDCPTDATPIPTSTPTPTPSITPSITPTPETTLTPTPSITVSITPTITQTPTITPTITITPSTTRPAYLTCEDTLTVSTNEVGYYTIPVEIGSDTGNVQSFFEASGLADRFVIEWNGSIVADSLFVGDGLTGSQGQDQVDDILATTSLDNYDYDGTGFPTSPSGSISTNFTESDIASTGDTRSSGSVGDQLGVIADYPSAGTPSSDGQVGLEFNKTSATPTTMYIHVYAPIGDIFTATEFDLTGFSCPTST